MTSSVDAPDVFSLPLARAARALRRGGIVAYPTEGVWGLGCDPENFAAVVQLLQLKQRDWRKGLILVAADFAQLEPYVEAPSRNALKRAFATWPGPATWLFPASEWTPHWISGDSDDIAVRVTAHPVASALCATFGGAIVSTSANRATRPAAQTATQVRLAFRRGVHAIVPGALGGLARPTTIRDVRTGGILRR